MNCKPGDLAMVIGGPNHGALCSILEPYEGCDDAWRCEALQGMALAQLFDPTMRPRPSGVHFAALDKHLLPLRGEPGEDEVLRIAGRPTESPADVIREVARCN